jgi:PAS domain S-box-containing protein
MRILLVEDNADHRELMRLTLTEYNATWQVEEVVSGEEALRHLAEKEAYDVVFLDYRLPGWDGLAVLEEIRRGEAPPPVVVVTGRGDEQVAVKAMKGGAYDYVVKAEDYLQRLPVVAQRAVEAHWLAVEHKRMEEVLRESERRWRNTFEAINDSVCLLDPEGRIVKHNHATEALAGKPGSEIDGRFCYEVVHGSSKPIANCPIIRMQRTKRRENLTLELDGRWLDVTVDPILDHNEKLIGAIHIVKDITERMRREEALRESEERYRLHFQQVSDVIYSLDSDLRILTVSPSVERTLGYRPEELIGRPFPELNLLVPSSLEAAILNTERALAGESIPETVYEFLARDGTPKWGEVRATPLLSSEGEVVAIIAVARDITARRQAEQALRESEERFREIFLHASLDMALLDREGQILGANLAFGRFLSYPPEEMSGMYLKELIHPKDLKKDAHWYEDLLQGKSKNHMIDKRLVRKNGEVVWGRLSVSLTRDSQGDPQHVILVCEDIHARKLAEEALHESEQRFRDLFESAPEAILITDEQGNFLEVNQRGLELTGLAYPELIQRNLLQDLVIPQDQEAMRKVFSGLQAGQRQVCEMRWETQDGRVILLEGSASPYLSEEGEFLSARFILRDVTKQREVEEALKESEARYRTVVEGSADGIFLTDVHTKCTLEANTAFLQMLGYTSEEIRNLSLYDFIAAEQEDIDQRLRQILSMKEKGAFTHERKYRRQDGSLVDVWVRGSVITYQGKEVMCTLARDISSYKRAQEALRQSEERYRAVVEQSPDGIFLEDVETRRLLEANTAFQSMVGYSPEEVKGLSIYDLVAADREDINRRFRKILRSKTPFTHERKYRRKDGSLADVWISGKVISYGGKRICCSLVRDISEQRRTQELLTSSFEEVRRLATHLQNVREEERIRIARELHDELAQSLTALKFDISGLQRRLESLSSAGDEVRPLMERIGSISELTDTMIDWARRLSGELRPPLLDDLGLVAALEREAEDFQSRSGIICRVISDLEAAALGKDQSTGLFRIAQESLTNAARHANATQVTVGLTERDGMILLRISDDGRGITAKEIANPKSFGLLGMRERCLVLGGNLEVQGSPPKGTTITVKIPTRR